MTLPSDPTPFVPGITLGSSERSLHEILEYVASLYQTIASGGGLPVQSGGAITGGRVPFVDQVQHINCAGGSVVTLGDISKNNQFTFTSLVFDNATPRDITISALINGVVCPCLHLPGYTGPYVLWTDPIQGPGFQVQISISAYAGSYTYTVAGTAQ